MQAALDTELGWSVLATHTYVLGTRHHVALVT